MIVKKKNNAMNCLSIHAHQCQSLALGLEGGLRE
jgi:hypothetical protein